MQHSNWPRSSRSEREMTALARAIGGSIVTTIGRLTAPSSWIVETAPMNTIHTMHQADTVSDQMSDALRTYR